MDLFINLWKMEKKGLEKGNKGSQRNEGRSYRITSFL